MKGRKRRANTGNKKDRMRKPRRGLGRMESVKDRRKARADRENRKGDTEGQTAAVLPSIAPQLQIPQAARGWGLSQRFSHTHTHTHRAEPSALLEAVGGREQATASPTGQSLELLLAFPQQKKKRLAKTNSSCTCEAKH